MPTSVELADLETLAVALASEAGRLIVDERPEELGVAATKSSATDIVTVMDQRSEQLLRRRLLAARPRDAVLGEEEGSSVRPADWSGLTWVVDPIDGTVNYLYGLPAYAVSVAVVTGDPTVPGEWEPVAGAVCSPAAGEVFHARRGGGAALRTRGAAAGSRRLHVGTGQELAGALVGTGFGYRAQDRARQGAVAAALLPGVRDLRRGGSAAIDLCSVAAGRLDAYYESGLHPWDLAAGRLVVEEAGGVVSGWQGRPPSGEMVIAASPSLHEELHGALRSAVEEIGRRVTA
jgi:myo-inositol-1(or 4)-monophosphatase